MYDPQLEDLTNSKGVLFRVIARGMGWPPASVYTPCPTLPRLLCGGCSCWGGLRRSLVFFPCTTCQQFPAVSARFKPTTRRPCQQVSAYLRRKHCRVTP